MRTSIALGLVACGLLALGSIGCGSTKRALVHEEDVAKVFPWPSNKNQVTIRVKPKTFWANTCSLLGSFEEVSVNQETTFYMVDKTDKKFAYTPARSPIRRLATVQSMEIRWPIAADEAPEENEAPEAGKQGGEKTAPAAKDGAQAPKEGDGAEGGKPPAGG